MGKKRKNRSQTATSASSRTCGSTERLSARAEMDLDDPEPSTSQPRGTQHFRADRFFLTRTPPDSDWDLEKDWAVEEITDHYIPQSGPKWYKVAWAEWTRDDGSNTTWVPEDEVVDDNERPLNVLPDYNQRRRAARLWIHPDLKGTEDLIQEKDINPYRFPEEQIGWLSLRTVESRLPRGNKLNIEALEAELIRMERTATESREPGGQEFGSIRSAERMSYTVEATTARELVRDDDELSYDSRPPEEYALEMERHQLSNQHPPPPLHPNLAGSERISEYDANLSPKLEPMDALPGSTQADMDPEYDPHFGPRPRLALSSPDIIVISDDSSDSSRDAAPRGRFKSLSLLDPDPRYGDTLQTYVEDGHTASGIEPEIMRRACGEAKFSVQIDWDEATTAAGAERIEITHDDSDDDEDCPALPIGFRYMERGYQVDKSIKPLRSHSSQGSASGLGCHCRQICDVNSPASCACQSYSEFNDRFSYDDLGHFLDNNKDDNGADAEVFECTSNCHCGPRCPNRTSQQPRDVTLQIFKTPDSGWAVRTPNHLPKGKVLGMFAGNLITRERAEALEKSRRLEWAHLNDPEVRRYNRFILDRRGYIFDLDCRELEEEDHAHDVPPSSPSRPQANRSRYSIDAWACGNWTRFINHSCEPNMKVYTAYHDPYDHENPPPGKLIFVTTRDIPAEEELTIDYDPRANKLGRGKQRKARHKGSLNVYEISQRQFNGSQIETASDLGAGSSTTLVDGSEPDMVPCHCDAPTYICRGFIRI